MTRDDDGIEETMEVLGTVLDDLRDSLGVDFEPVRAAVDTDEAWTYMTGTKCRVALTYAGPDRYGTDTWRIQIDPDGDGADLTDTEWAEYLSAFARGALGVYIESGRIAPVPAPVPDASLSGPGAADATPGMGI